MAPTDPPRDWVRLSRGWSRVCAAAAAGIALVELFVWMVRPASVPSSSSIFYMKGNAALGVLCLAAGAWLGIGDVGVWRRRGAVACAALTLALGVPTLLEYAGVAVPRLDGLFGFDPTPDAGRMAAQTAGVLALLAIALIGWNRSRGAASWIVDGAIVVTVFTLEVMVTGYFDHATLLYDVTAKAPAARQSAIAQMLLCAALAFGRVGRGAFAMFSQRDMGSAAMRMIVPAIVALPVALGKLRQMVEDRGWLQPAYAHAIFSVAETAILGLVVYAFARYVSRLDERYRLERQRRQEIERYVAVCAWTRRIRWQGEWVSIEDFLQRRFGLEVTHGISDEALAEQLAGMDPDGLVAPEPEGDRP